MQAMLPEGFPFPQFNVIKRFLILSRIITLRYNSYIYFAIIFDKKYMKYPSTKVMLQKVLGEANVSFVTLTDALTTPKPNHILYIMPCMCVKNKTWTNMTQEQIIEYLTKELTIPKNATTRSQNKLISRSDPRQSSSIVGTVGLALICGVFGIVLLTDIPALMRHLRAAITGQHELLWRDF